jgi:YD repeat-containing protein
VNAVSFYNAVNEQSSETNALDQTTTYGYDGVGTQTSVTNPLGNATTYGFNAANEKTSMTDALGNTTTYGYDKAGEQTSVTDPPPLLQGKPRAKSSSANASARRHAQHGWSG